MTAKLAKIVLSITVGMFGLVLVMSMLAGAGPVAAKEEIGESSGSVLLAGDPETVTVEASAAVIKADGASTATITGTVKDGSLNPVGSGAFIAFATNLGTIGPYCYVEAEADAVIKSAGWYTDSLASASGGLYVEVSGNNFPHAALSWTFTATAISMLYVSDSSTGGVAEVQVDSRTPVTVAMCSGTWMAAERVIAAGLEAGEPHTITVRQLQSPPECPGGPGGPWIYVDAFRCGATTDGNGQGTATLTSEVLPCGSEDAIVTALTGDSFPPPPYMITNTVSVEMAASSPASMTVTANPNPIVANGISTTLLTAVVEDLFGDDVPDHTMVGFVIDEDGSDPGVWGLLPYELVEGEDATQVITDGWSIHSNGHYGGQAIYTNTAGRTASWDFTGTAVSLIYPKLSDAGVATVTVGSGTPITIDMYAPSPGQYQVEHVITDTLIFGSHTITVTVGGYTVTGGTDTRVYVDAFRSGTSTSGSEATAVLTSGTKAGVLWVEATAVDIPCCETTSVETETVAITLTAGNPYTLTITPTDIITDCCNTSTLQFTVTDQYTNVVGAVVPRPLTVTFDSTPQGIFTNTSVVITDGVGSVEFHGWTSGTGTITGTVSGYPDVIGTANLTVSASSCQTLTISADPEWIYVTDTYASSLSGFIYTSTTVADLWDSCANPVGSTVVTFTTSLGNLGSNTVTKTTASGVATATLTSEQWWTGVPTQTTSPTQTAYIVITGTNCLVTGTTSIDFVRHVYTLTVAAAPDEIKIGTYTSTLTADVYDGSGKPTLDGVKVGFTITNATMATVPSAEEDTENGTAMAIATSVTQTGVTTIEAAVIVTGGATISNTSLITITAGDPYTLTITPTDIITDCCNTSTLQFTVTDQYTNVVGVMVPRPLTVTFDSTPQGIFTPTSPVVITKGVGSVKFHGWMSGTGTITGTVSGYTVTGTANLTVAASSCQTLTISADQEWIYVTDTNTSLLTDFPYTTTVTADLRDSCANPIDGTVVTFTTSLGSLGNVSPVTRTTINGQATATLASAQLSPGVLTQTAYITVTGTNCPVTGTTSVDFVRHVYTLTVAADPNEIEVGGNPSTLTADVDNGRGSPTPDGVMVGFTITPTLASLPYEYVEAEGPRVTASGWPTGADGAVTYITTNTIGTQASWNFTGTAVSFIYYQDLDGGAVTVTIDSPAYTRIISMAGPADWVEQVITTSLSLASRNVTVTVETTGTDDIKIDAFRSGATISGDAGQATAVITSGTQAGVATFEAAAIGSTITNTGQITITAVEPDGTIIMIMTPTDINIDCRGIETLQFTVTDKYGNVMGAVKPITLTMNFTKEIGSGDGVCKFTPAVDFDITDGVGSVEIQGWMSGTGRIKGSPEYLVAAYSNFTVSAGSPVTLTIARAPAIIRSDDIDAAVITATVQDACGNLLCSKIVTFRTSVGSFDTPTELLGSTQIRGVQRTPPRMIDFAPSYLSLSTFLRPDIGVGGGEMLTLEVLPHESTLAPPPPTLLITKTTSCSGVATATLRSWATFSGRATITVTVDTLTKTTYVDMGGAVFKVELEADPPSIEMDGDTSTLTATVKDVLANPVADGTVVTFTTSLGRLSSGPITNTTTSATTGGVATAVLTSETTAGTAVIMAASASADSATTTVTIEAGPPATLALVADPPSLAAGGTSTLSATVTDQYGNNVDVATVVTFTASLGSLGSYTGTTSGGVVTTVLTSTVHEVGTAFVTATVGSGVDMVTGTTTVIFTAGPAYTVTLEVNPTSLTVDETSALTATVRDAHGYLVEPTVVTFTTSLGSLSSDTVTTTNGKATAMLTSQEDGTATVTATIGVTSAVRTVVFSVGAPATVTLVADPPSLAAGGTSTLSVTVTDQYENLVGPTVVTFTASLGNLGSYTGTTSGGVVTTVLTSTVHEVGTAFVTATVGSGVDMVTGTTTVIFTAGPAYTVTLEVNPTGLTVDETSALTATVRDQYDNLVGPTVVTFTTSLGSLSSDTVTTTNGKATATLTSQEDGTATVTATIGVTSAVRTVVFSVGAPATVTLEAYPMTLTVGSSSALTATVKDQYGNDVADGTDVLFETNLGSLGSLTVTETTVDGIAVAALTSQSPGTATVVATADSVSDAVDVTFEVGPPYTVTLEANPMTLTVGGTSTLTATVKDQYDNDVADGTSVLFETNLGSLGSLAVTKTTASGIAVATLTSQAPGVATVVATADPVSGTVDVTFSGGPVYTVTLEADPESIGVGGLTLILTVTVTDQYTNPVADNTVVTFTTSSGSLGSDPFTSTTTSGVATAVLTSPDTVGTAFITATADSKVGTATVEFTPLSPYTLTLVAYPTDLTVVDTSTLSATVKDQYDNNVADGTVVTFTTSLGEVGSELVTKTTTSGVATAELSSQVPGTATVTATADPVSDTVDVTFEVGPPYTVTLVAYPTSLTVGATSTLTVTVSDQFNNNVADGTVVNFETNLGSLGSTTVSKTTVSGVATATLTSQVAGTAVVTATSDSKYGTANVTFNPDLPYTMTVEAYPTSIPIGGFTSEIAATVKDQYDNPVADGTEVTLITDLGSIGSNSVVKITTNGVANATLTSDLIIGTANITATSGSAEGQTQVIFTVGAPYTITVKSYPPTIEVGGSTATITATVTDIGGYPVADGTPVVFTTDFASLGSSTVTKYTTDGVAVATLTSGTTPGVAHITATADSKFDTATVKVAAGPPFSIDVIANPTYIPIGGATSLITATVQDRYGNNVTNGTNVDFITTLGSVSPPSGATDEGMAVTTLTSGIITGPATVAAIAGPEEGSVEVIFTVGPPFYISVVADPLNIALNGHTSNIQAAVKDIGGNNVADGTEVTFATSLGLLGSDTVIKTTTSGVAIATLTSETTAGTAVITATADSHCHTTKVVFSPDPPHNVTVTADPMAIPANGVSTSTVWATVIDQYGNMVADGITCYFSTTLGGVWPPLDTTLNGVAETTLTSSETTGLAAVTATCESIPDTIYVSFYVPAFKIYLPTILKAY